MSTTSESAEPDERSGVSTIPPADEASTPAKEDADGAGECTCCRFHPPKKKDNVPKWLATGHFAWVMGAMALGLAAGYYIAFNAYFGALEYVREIELSAGGGEGVGVVDIPSEGADSPLFLPYYAGQIAFWGIAIAGIGAALRAWAHQRDGWLRVADHAGKLVAVVAFVVAVMAAVVRIEQVFREKYEPQLWTAVGVLLGLAALSFVVQWLWRRRRPKSVRELSE